MYSTIAKAIGPFKLEYSYYVELNHLLLEKLIKASHGEGKVHNQK